MNANKFVFSILYTYMLTFLAIEILKIDMGSLAIFAIAVIVGRFVYTKF